VTEAEVLERARGGDQVAMRRLYDENVDRVYHLAFRMAGEEDLARDFTQDAFIRAFQRLDQFAGRAAFSTWLHSVAVSVCLNGLRKRKREREREWGLDDVGPLAVAAEDVRPQVRDRLHAAIDSLPELYRTVFVLYDVEGYRHEEIAEMLDVAVGTSKARLSRARGRLRESLGDLAGELA
jgi:RNA polymerase sigma-70 factor (ECF subfamily)